MALIVRDCKCETSLRMGFEYIIISIPKIYMRNIILAYYPAENYNFGKQRTNYAKKRIGFSFLMESRQIGCPGGCKETDYPAL